MNLQDYQKEKLMYYLARDYLDYDKIDIMMKDPYIEDISCNGPKRAPIHLAQGLRVNPHKHIFTNDSELDAYIIRLAYKSKRMISVANPILDAALPDGSRAQMTYSKYATKQGSTFTIRKFKADPTDNRGPDQESHDLGEDGRPLLVSGREQDQHLLLWWRGVW